MSIRIETSIVGIFDNNIESIFFFDFVIDDLKWYDKNFDTIIDDTKQQLLDRLKRIYRITRNMQRENNEINKCLMPLILILSNTTSSVHISFKK